VDGEMIKLVVAPALFGAEEPELEAASLATSASSD